MEWVFEKIIDGEKWVAPKLEYLPLLVGKFVRIYYSSNDHVEDFRASGIITEHRGTYLGWSLPDGIPNQHFYLDGFKNWFVTQSNEWQYIMYIREKDIVVIENNKGRKDCWKCSCKTELRRDFKDFSIREFCPRCKI